MVSPLVAVRTVETAWQVAEEASAFPNAKRHPGQRGQAGARGFQCGLHVGERRGPDVDRQRPPHVILVFDGVFEDLGRVRRPAVHGRSDRAAGLR